GRQLLDTLQAQNVVRVGRAVNDELALVHYLTIVHQNLLFLGDQEFVADAVEVRDHQALLALGVLAERHGTRDVCQHAGILGRTRFEQLGHAWQTAGNIAGLLRFLRNTRQNVAHIDLLTVAHGDQGTDRERNAHGVLGAGDLDFLALLIDELDLRTHDLLGRATGLGRDHHQGRQARDLVHLAGYGYTFLDVLELDG